MEIRQPKYNYTLCFEAPLSTAGGDAGTTTASTSTAAPGGVVSAPSAPTKTTASRAPSVLPMLLPSATPLGNSFTTPMFHTPSSVASRSVADRGSSSHGNRTGSSFITPGSVSGSIGRPPSISFSIPRTGSSHRSDSNTSYRSGSNSTPNTSMSFEEQGLVIVAVAEGRGLAKGEVGVASIDLKQPVLLLSQFPDTAMYVKCTTKLLALRPVEIVMPNTINDSISKTKLFQLIRDQFSESTVSTVQRKYFNERLGLEKVRNLCAPDFNSVEMDIEKKYYALSAAAALLKYVEFIQNIVFAPNSLRVKFHGSEKTTLIDVTTAKNLELLANSRNPTNPLSLASLLNFTKTKGGARLLRSNILEPPCHLETILLRQECIKELTGSQELFYSLGSVLKRFLNVDQLISMCVQVPKRDTRKTADKAITYVIYLKHTVELVPSLREALQQTSNPLLVAISKVLDDPRYDTILSLIGTVVHDKTHYQKGALNMRTQKCFCIRDDISGMLDVTRKIHAEAIDDILLITDQLADKYNLPLKSGFNNTRGFYLQLFTGNTAVRKGKGRGQRKDSAVGMTADQLPAEFIKVARLKNTLSFTTMDLIKLNNRAEDSLTDIYRMTHIVLKDLMDDIRLHVGCLYRLSECVAMLDMLHSFSHSVTVSNYVCPEFSPDTLAIKQGRHPMLDKMIYNQPVPNNTYASTCSNFTIITGPNMSGKSSYLRQIALLQIMAQMGCFVPAEYACFRLANQIFSRIGSDDDMEKNASTFMVELREMNYILQNLDETSLIIIDELGRGTSVDEGMGYCFAFAERLLTTNAFTFLATHFQQVTNLQSMYPNVENYHFELRSVMSDEEAWHKGAEFNGEDNVTHSHVLTKGVAKKNHYGLRLAELSLFPPSVIAGAKELVKRLEVKEIERQQPSLESRKSRLVRGVATTLIQVARNSQLDQTALKSYLSHVKSKYIKDMNELSQHSTNTDYQSSEP